MTSNSDISKKFKLTAKLMELHGENDFKVRAYQKTVDIIKMLDVDLSQIPAKELLDIEGIGKSSAEKIAEIIEKGSFEKLDSLLNATPVGVVEMLSTPGFGAKKIALVWKEAGAESWDELLILCEQGKIAPLKGFGDKSQESLLKAVVFKMNSRGKSRYATIEPIFLNIIDHLKLNIPLVKISETGSVRRRTDIIFKLEILVGNDDFDESRKAVNSHDQLQENELVSGPFSWAGKHTEAGVNLKVRFCKEKNYEKELIKTTGSVNHLNSKLSTGIKLKDALNAATVSSEKDFYDSLGLQYIEPELREGSFEIELAAKKELPTLIEMDDLKGILHNHSTYSDGKHTLRQMAEYCKELGYEYLGISDHSQTAVYAGGLHEYNVKEQQDEIKKLNEELAPFKVLSGIESDILSDGSLDYPDEILASFDYIVASVHSGLNMDINKATNRLLAAIRNPYTTILGHMTGRLLLDREGYPVDHKEIIHACAENNVVIEINASPARLDMDWRWVNYALEQGVMLSINPDAHAKEGYKNMYYGLLAGRKGGLTKNQTMNAMSLKEITKYLETRKTKIMV
ncbi:MAG: DNA polymerase (family 10) [Cyclobacteriaceae bacterium]|jgi:DNA polymerase (family 10)